ncbi:acyl carrier protein [Ruminiclostridium cellulolyticum]|uniref:Phosphopantetheine-binding n=1 Tax=Ruminiclostridium cellulolyticum (strain ATCC 35319 / DSM 5812 / JCM 6584 / H10) TaxID=394503 RepID=B8I672_RUMCH|nr:acyl carrier protein [Ruminiclostridium cellulolyticum]ACL76837.1 phosphopantetheine-binding [Ruminiclostridium cellulolyticum H10]
MEIKEQIVSVIASVLNIEPGQINCVSEDENLNRVGVDSVNFIEIIIGLEDKLNIVFDDEELLLDNLNTLKKLEKVISQKLED